MKREYYFVIFFLVLAIFLVGCSGGGITTPATETEEGDFQEVVNLLDTPEKLVDYMAKNFKHYVEVYGEPPDGYNPYLPEDFFYIRVGNCEDFSAFSSYVLDQHGYDVFLLYYMALSHENGDIYGHTVSVFHNEDGKLKYITNVGGPNKETLFSVFGPFDTIGQIITKEEVRIGGQVFLHGFTYLGSVGEQMEPQSFEEAINQLNKPSKILNYMTRNFQFKIDPTRPTLSPQQLFQTREGNKYDFNIFISYLLDHHGYETQMLRLEFTENDMVNGYDIIVIYRDVDNNLKSITHHGEQVMRVSQTYNSLDDLIRHVENVRSLSSSSEARVYRYGFLAPGITNLMPTEWITFSSE
jgi:uncharacterized protein YdcH (DUF465 family)